MTLANYRLSYELPRTHKLYYGRDYVTEADRTAAYTVMVWSILRLCVGSMLFVVSEYLELYIKGLQRLHVWLRKVQSWLH